MSKTNGHTLLNRFGAPLGRSRPVASTSYYDATAYNGRVRRHVNATIGDPSATLDRASRERLLGLARYLHANSGIVRGAIEDLATYSIGNGLIPQSQAQPETAQAYEDFFREWSKIADATGHLTFGQMQRVASMRLDVDGDIGFLLVSTKTGFPRLQMVEAHRIAAEHDAKAFVDGVRTAKDGRVISYSIKEGERHRRVAADDFVLLLEPERAQQTRGVTALVHAITHLQDVQDIVHYEKVAVKMNSAIGIAIKTESGAADAGSSYIESGYTSTDTGGLALDTFSAGMVPRLKIGESIDSFGSARPSPAFEGFIDFLVREVAVGLGMPQEFIWNPQGLVGATQRFVLGKAARRFEERQHLFVHRFLNRIWGWVISKGIKRGDIPASDDWHKVVWQRPAKISVDIGREAAANRDDIRTGIRSVAEDAGERGIDWMELRDQKEREATDLIERARRLSERHDISMEFAASLMGSSSPNPPTDPEPPAEEEDDE